MPRIIVNPGKSSKILKQYHVILWLTYQNYNSVWWTLSSKRRSLDDKTFASKSIKIWGGNCTLCLPDSTGPASRRRSRVAWATAPAHVCSYAWMLHQALDMSFQRRAAQYEPEILCKNVWFTTRFRVSFSYLTWRKTSSNHYFCTSWCIQKYDEFFYKKVLYLRVLII